MRKITLMGIVLFLSVVVSILNAQTKVSKAVGDTLFQVDFKAKPAAFTSGDVYATSATASQEKVVGTLTFGNGVSRQRINMNISQSAKTFETGGDYASHTAADDGATNGAFSFLGVGTGTAGGGYFITTPVTGPCEIDVWTCSGNTYQQKYYVYFIENDGTPLLEAATTIVAGKKIKKNTYKYEGTGSLKIKFVCSELQSSSNTNLYFYNVVVKEALAPTAPTIALVSGKTTQYAQPAKAISPIIYKRAGTANATNVTWTGTANAATPPVGISVVTDAVTKLTTISGNLNEVGNYGYTITSTDGVNTTDALTGTLVCKPTQSKKLAYVTTLTNGMPGDYDFNIINKLFDYFTVDYISSAATSVDFSSYNLIVLSAMPNSGDAGLVELEAVSLTKPFVNMKTFQLQSSRWNWLTPANTTTTTIVVPTLLKDHALFTGITFSGTSEDEIILSTGSGVNAAVNVTAWAGTSTPANPTTLATVKAATGEGCYFEIPTGTSINGNTATATGAKHVILGLSEASWGTATEDALRLAVNAARYVAGDFTTKNNSTLSNANKTIVNREYFDITGRKASALAKGLLIEKQNFSDGSASYKKIYTKGL